MDEEGGYHVFGQNFLSHITGNFFWETFVPYVFPSKVFCLTIPKILIGNSSCFQKISVMGGIEWTRRAASQISVKFDFASFYRKISFGTLRCLREILAAKSFYGCQGVIPRFSVDIFLSHITANFFWHFFGVSKYFWQRKVCMDERKEYNVFPSKNFWITVSEKFIGKFCGFRDFVVCGKK